MSSITKTLATFLAVLSALMLISCTNPTDSHQTSSVSSEPLASAFHAMNSDPLQTATLEPTPSPPKSTPTPTAEPTDTPKPTAAPHTEHTYNNGKVDKKTGNVKYTCTVCGHTYVDTTKYDQALAVAKTIAARATGSTDLDRVSVAAQIVAEYCSQAVYTSSDPDYCNAYGVFIKGVYTCAGSTRALGMVLECMGFQWQHVNENQYTHQWCRLTMDGQLGYADGQVGWAGYGAHPVE